MRNSNHHSLRDKKYYIISSFIFYILVVNVTNVVKFMVFFQKDSTKYLTRRIIIVISSIDFFAFQITEKRRFSLPLIRST